METGSDSINRWRNIPSLDGLRAVSIFLVLVSHAAVNIYETYSASFSRIESIIQTFFLVGHLGVMIFFVISGFLISTLLLREEKIDLQRFYFRRTFKIFPPYYFYLLVILCLSLFGIIETSAQNSFAAFTYTTNYFFQDTKDSWYTSHTWSLAVEEQFYLIYPALLLLLGKRRGLMMVCAVVLICPVLRLINIINQPDALVEFSRFETIADSLAFGCVLAGFRTTLHQKEWYIRFLQSKLFVIAPFIALAITVIARFPKYYPKSLYVLLAITIQNICISLCLDWCITNYRGRVGNILNSRLLSYVGIMSYSLYLWQQPFFNPNLKLAIPIKLGLTFLATLCSYYMIEKPSLKLRQNIENRIFKPIVKIQVAILNNIFK